MIIKLKLFIQFEFKRIVQVLFFFLFLENPPECLVFIRLVTVIFSQIMHLKVVKSIIAFSFIIGTNWCFFLFGLMFFHLFDDIFTQFFIIIDILFIWLAVPWNVINKLIFICVKFYFNRKINLDIIQSFGILRLFQRLICFFVIQIIFLLISYFILSKSKSFSQCFFQFFLAHFF